MTGRQGDCTSRRGEVTRIQGDIATGVHDQSTGSARDIGIQQNVAAGRCQRHHPGTDCSHGTADRFRSTGGQADRSIGRGRHDAARGRQGTGLVNDHLAAGFANAGDRQQTGFVREPDVTTGRIRGAKGIDQIRVVQRGPGLR